MAALPTLFDEFSYTGQWWLPDDPDTKWKGTVSCRPGSGIVLKLSDDWRKSFVSPEDAPSDEGSFQADYLVLSSQAHSQKETKFESIDVTYSSLNGWLWTLSPPSTEPCLLLEIKLPTIKAKLSLYKLDEQYATDALRKFNSVNFIRITPNSPQDICWFREQIDRIRDLLSFFSGLPMETKSVKCKPTEQSLRLEDFHVYYNVRQQDMDQDTNAKMAFAFEILGADLTISVFQAWFEKRMFEWAAFNLCLGVIFNEHRHREFEFLVLVFALDSLHRRLQLKGSNLQGRLIKLRETLPAQLREFMPLKSEYLKLVVDTRDFYTHGDPNIEKYRVVLKNLDLYEAITRLIPFIVACLALELDVSEDKVHEVLMRTRVRGLWLRPAREFGGPDVLR